MRTIDLVIPALHNFSNPTIEELENYIKLQGFDKPMGFFMMLNNNELKSILACINNLNEGDMFGDVLENKDYSIVGNKIIWSFLCKSLDFDSDDMLEVLVDEDFDDKINLIYSKILSASLAKEGLIKIKYDKDNEDKTTIVPNKYEIEGFNFDNTLQ